MASWGQIKYARSLLEKGGYDPGRFNLEHLSTRDCSELIDKLIAGEKVSVPTPIETSKGRQMFHKELEMIKTKDVKELIMNAVDNIPDYFWEIPASSTGKYHPEYCLGTGGVYRHTKAAVKIAYELLYSHPNSGDIFGIETTIDRDIAIASLIIHDAVKSGYPQERYSRADHPMLVIDTLLPGFVADNYWKNSLVSCVEAHMGPWNRDYRTKKPIMPIPSNRLEWFVHLCDYLASRKYLEVKDL